MFLKWTLEKKQEINDGVIGSYFQNEVGDAVTVNRARYRTMVRDYF